MNTSTISINIPARGADAGSDVRYFTSDIATGSDSAIDAERVDVGPLGNVVVCAAARGPRAEAATAIVTDTADELFSPGRVAGMVMNSHDGVNRFMSGVMAEMHRRMRSLADADGTHLTPQEARMLRASAGILWIIGRRVYACCCGDISATIYSDDDGSTSTLVAADRRYLGDTSTLQTAATLRVPYLMNNGDKASLTNGPDPLLTLGVVGGAPRAVDMRRVEPEPTPAAAPAPRPAAPSRPEPAPTARPAISTKASAPAAAPAPAHAPVTPESRTRNYDDDRHDLPARRGFDWRLVGMILSLVAIVGATAAFFLWTGSDDGPGADAEAAGTIELSESIMPADYTPATPAADTTQPAAGTTQPAAGTTAAAPEPVAAPKPAETRTYTVVKGDNSWRLVTKHINEKYGTSFTEEEIRAAQPEKVGKSDVIYLDAVLNVPNTSPQAQ